MSATTETSSTSQSLRTKDGIPTWGGDASTFTLYEESALNWEQSLTWEKRYVAGSKLVQELTGAAKRYVAGQPPGWVSFRGGVAALMNHLRQALGKPRVNEVTDLLALYFKGTRRKSGESMNEYITRKNEAYMRALPIHEAGATTLRDQWFRCRKPGLGATQKKQLGLWIPAKHMEPAMDTRYRWRWTCGLRRGSSDTGWHR